MKRWGERFLSSTRGQVVQLLRRKEATVRDLAEKLDLTHNAIRAHLTTLERDGLIEASGKRPGVRKPETVYALTHDAELLFPKAYDLLVNRFLDALAKRLSSAEIEEILREVGRDLAPKPTGSSDEIDYQDAVEKALDVTCRLGGLAEIAEGDPGLIVGFSCPVGTVASEHSNICQLIEALLSEIIGVPVYEQCDREGTPRCVFRIGPEEA